jgi:biopolymer transport protein TolQ
MSWPVKLVILTLLVMSVLSIAAIYRIWCVFREWDEESSIFLKRYNNIEEMPTHNKPYDPLTLVFGVGISEWSHAFKKYGLAMAIERTKESCDAAKAQWLAVVHKDLAWLSTIASVAPYVGVLGTVLGISECFRATEVSQLAFSAGFAEALVTTAGGLFVAIPATFASYYYAGYVAQWESKIHCFVQKLIADLAYKG